MFKLFRSSIGRPVILNLKCIRRNLSQEMDEIKQNPYYKKYADKIGALQQTSPDEFLDRIEKAQKNKLPKNITQNSEMKEITRQPNKMQTSNNPFHTRQKIVNNTLDSLETLLDNQFHLLPANFFRSVTKSLVPNQKINKTSFLSCLRGYIRTCTADSMLEELTPMVEKDAPLLSVRRMASCVSRQNYFTPNRTLDSVMKVELLKDKSTEEISKIWQEFHKTKAGISAVIPDSIYKNIYSNSQEFPTFLYPLPRKEGFEFVMSQFSDHECHFTLLINFQAYKENAPVCLSIIHYPDMQNEKGIVLMHGEFDNQMLTVQEAQCLANQVQLYYGGMSANKMDLLRTFNKYPDKFKHTDLIKEFECIET